MSDRRIAAALATAAGTDEPRAAVIFDGLTEAADALRAFRAAVASLDALWGEAVSAGKAMERARQSAERATAPLVRLVSG